MRTRLWIAARVVAVATCLPMASSAVRSAEVHAQVETGQERLVVFEMFTPPQASGG